MNTQSDPVVPATLPMYWSVRRELWEHRSIYIALLAAAGVGVFAFFFSLAHLARTMSELTALDPARQFVEVAMPYSHLAMLLDFTAVIVGLVYCLDALHAERRDRSILFWKSMPVSDLTTVLSKAAIPLLVLPLLVFAITVPVQLIMLLLSTMVLLLGRGSLSTLWTHLPLFQMEVVQLYSLVVFTLWYAPIYGWLLLVSSWARRTVFLWAVLPLLAICAVEKIAFNTSYLGSVLVDRLFGVAGKAFVLTTPDGAMIDAHFIPLTQLAPGRFLSSPGLWIGLAFAVVFVAAAVRLRRYREPI